MYFAALICREIFIKTSVTRENFVEPQISVYPVFYKRVRVFVHAALDLITVSHVEKYTPCALSELYASVTPIGILATRSIYFSTRPNRLAHIFCTYVLRATLGTYTGVA